METWKKGVIALGAVIGGIGLYVLYEVEKAKAEAQAAEAFSLSYAVEQLASSNAAITAIPKTQIAEENYSPVDDAAEYIYHITTGATNTLINTAPASQPVSNPSETSSSLPPDWQAETYQPNKLYKEAIKNSITHLIQHGPAQQVTTSQGSSSGLAKRLGGWAAY